MAKYEIKHSCGCIETVNICGTNVHGERERQAERMAARPCKACAAKAAAERASESGLPELTGSEKQVAWAVQIREDIMAKMESAGHGTAWVESITSAGEWIDMRFDSTATIAERYISCVKKVEKGQDETTVFTAKNREDFPALLAYMRERLAGNEDHLAAVDKFEAAVNEHMDDFTITRSGTLANAIGEVWMVSYAPSLGGSKSTFVSVFKAAIAAAKKLGL